MPILPRKGHKDLAPKLVGKHFRRKRQLHSPFALLAIDRAKRRQGRHNPSGWPHRGSGGVVDVGIGKSKIGNRLPKARCLNDMQCVGREGGASVIEAVVLEIEIPAVVKHHPGGIPQADGNRVGRRNTHRSRGDINMHRLD